MLQHSCCTEDFERKHDIINGYPLNSNPNMIYLKDFGGKTLHNMVIMWISGDQERILLCILELQGEGMWLWLLALVTFDK